MEHLISFLNIILPYLKNIWNQQVISCASVIIYKFDNLPLIPRTHVEAAEKKL